MSDTNHKTILDKAHEAKLADTPVSQFMITNIVTLQNTYSVKGTIEIFRSHHISGAPVIDSNDKIIGLITEYDLLIQASTKLLSSSIDYNSKVISVYPETTLKEVIITLYKHKLKWMPVVNKEKYIQGIVARIDVLNFIATHSEH